jgi:hypothetical protein
MAELVVCGVAYHHAGLDSSDRKSIEAMFTNGELPVLCMNVILYISMLVSIDVANLRQKLFGKIQKIIIALRSRQIF